MFDSGSAVVQPHTCANLLREIGAVLFAEVPNRLTLEGHTDAQRLPAATAATATGSCPADRANASRASW